MSLLSKHVCIFIVSFCIYTSQDSFSYSSIHEGEEETLSVPEVYVADISLPPPSVLASSSSNSHTLSNSISSSVRTYENVDCGYENKNIYLPERDTPLPEQVPEAHPFDLSLRNRTSDSPYPGFTLSNCQRSLSSGQVSPLHSLSKSLSPSSAVTAVSCKPRQISEHASSSLPVSVMNLRLDAVQADQTMSQGILCSRLQNTGITHSKSVTEKVVSTQFNDLLLLTVHAMLR